MALTGCGADTGPGNTDAALTDVKAINAGGPLAGSFSADEDFSGVSRTATWAHAVDTSGVSNPAPEAVYQSERYGNQFTYAIPQLIAGASYTVRLHFSEDYWNSSGSRLFNVVLNGASVLSSFDIFAKAGGQYKAVVEQFTTNASASGQIVIAFSTVKDNAKIDGIEIVSTPSTTSTVVNNRSGLCLGTNGSTSTGATLEQLTCNGSSDEQFKLVANGNGYQLTDVHSGLCLRPLGGGTAPNTTLVQDTCNGSDSSQQFTLQTVSSGVYYLINVKSSLCVTDRQDLQTTGNPQEIYTCIQSDSQAFRVSVSTGAPSNLTYSANPLVATQGRTITPDLPSSTGGAPTSYTSNKTLPPGLTLSASTGIVSGTPSAVTAQADYVITAKNASGSTQVTLTVVVESGTSPWLFSDLFSNSPLLTPISTLKAQGAQVVPHQYMDSLWNQGWPTRNVYTEIPIYYSKSTDHVVTVNCVHDWGNGHPVPCNANGLQIHENVNDYIQWIDSIQPGNCDAYPKGCEDHHLLLVDQASSMGPVEFDCWQAGPRSATSTLVGNTLNCTWGGVYPLGGNGLHGNLPTQTAGGSEGLHFGPAAGEFMLTGTELLNGQINHALALNASCLNNPSVYPADTSSGTDTACDGSNNPPHYGNVMHLLWSPQQIANSAYSAPCKTVLTALATYGAYASDTGDVGIQIDVEAEKAYISNGAADPYPQIIRELQAAGDADSSGHWTDCTNRLTSNDFELLELKAP